MFLLSQTIYIEDTESTFLHTEVGGGLLQELAIHQIMLVAFATSAPVVRWVGLVVAFAAVFVRF
jgi:hypothetical protein